LIFWREIYLARRMLSQKFIDTVSFLILFLLIIIAVDVIVISSELTSVGWKILDYLKYAGKSILINFIFVFVVGLLLYGVYSLLGFLTKKDFFRVRKFQKIISLSISILIVAILIPVINYYYLPSILYLKSILANILIILLIIPLSLILYKSTTMYSGLNKNLKLISLIIGILLFMILIVISFYKPPETDNIAGISGEIEKKPSIIIVTIDALRADHLSCYGYTKIETGNIDKIAKDGYLFTNAYAVTSWTTPSMMSMLTGKYPDVHRCIDYSHRVPDGIMSIPQILKSYGYRTEAIIANMNLSPRFGFSRGFHRYIQYGDIQYLSLFKDTRLSNLFQRFQSLFLGGLHLVKDSTFWATEKMKRSIISNKEESLFLWVHYMDPHAPYEPPIEYIPDAYEPSEDTIVYLKENPVVYGGKSYDRSDKNSILNLYDGEILYVDDKLGEVIDLLKDNELYNKSLIIITADHGEAFWEHNLRDHGKTLYNEMLKIPFIMKFPEGYNYSNRKVIDTPISLIDIPGTLLDFLGIDTIEQYSDRSIIDILQEDEPVDNDIFHEVLMDNPEAMKIQNKKFSLIYDAKSGREEFYHIAKDPYELEDASDDFPEEKEEMFERLSEWVRSIQKEREIYGEGEITGLDKKTLEEMRGLGYIE
jgi:arylsulfatase